MTFGVVSPRIFKPPGYVVATCFISVAGWLNGYDTGSAGAVTEMPYFHQTFGELTPFMHGLTVSMILLTGAFPSIYAGQLADYVGRLRAIMIGALLFVVGALLQGMAPKLSIFLAGRAIGGIGMGTWMAPQAVYVTEIAPSMRRGMLMATPQLGVVFGICCGYFTAYGTVKVDSIWSFRSIYIIQAGMGLLLAIICNLLPESPRWLLFQSRRSDAIRQLERLNFSPIEAEKDLLGPSAARTITAQPNPLTAIFTIFSAPYRTRTTLALIMLGMIQLSGIDGVLYYAPRLFAQAGLPATTASFIASGVSAILMFAITIPALLLTDRFTRRSITLTGGLILTTCMLLIGSLYASNAITPTSPARFLVISLVFIFGLTYCCTWGIVGKIYASEIQPPQTRSMANCVAQGIGFLTNWLVTILTPIFLAESSYGAYFLFGGFCLTSVVLLWSFMPETKGLSLEGIEEVFNTNGVFVGGSRLARGIRRVFARGHEGGRGEEGSVISLQEALRERGGDAEGMESRTSGVSAGLQQGVPAMLRVETI
ncbi:general substrate transporter [Elsinoe ampelina]|uniref:General substrate transporter n=1 Tax=Elsinoe ampelina TaxID=302913 RepID=A0A6A6G366_9PEZI|nr:general substrate transporter [Elsinoe ampelina]